MIVAPRGDGPCPAPRRRWVRTWQLWSVNRAGVAFLLGFELLAVTLTVSGLLNEKLTGAAAVRLVLLFGLHLVYTEVSDRVERVRRYLGSGQVGSNEVSVWALAGALVLPVGYAALLVTAVYGHTLLLDRRHHSLRPHRAVFGAAVGVLGTLAAAWVRPIVVTALDPLLGKGAGGAAATLAALLVFLAVTSAVMGCGLYFAARPPTWRAVLPARDQITFEVATLLLGVVTAEFLMHAPWLCPAVLLLLAIMHRSTMVEQLQLAATTDAKTGLLNAGAWRGLAEKALHRAGRDDAQSALLIIDLDHFKQVNDTFGHQAGDVVLAATADTIKQELRDYDAVGRFGGEEFIALLENVTAAGAAVIGARLRERIRSLKFEYDLVVTASIGLACHPSDAGDLDALIAAADTALYAAKAAGRDRIRFATG